MSATDSTDEFHRVSADEQPRVAVECTHRRLGAGIVGNSLVYHLSRLGRDDIVQIEADLLDAAVGASRAAVNEGWRSHDDQVGQTGARISPTLYIPCGISGAVQHMVGAKGSEYILPINTDPEAAIIGHADYAVIGDLHEVVPELNEALRERVN